MGNEGDIRKDRKPLLEKLEPMRQERRGRAFHSEAKEWSKVGRGLVQRFFDFLDDLWNA